LCVYSSFNFAPFIGIGTHARCVRCVCLILAIVSTHSKVSSPDARFLPVAAGSYFTHPH
jgi:hypothetical protein